MGEGVQDPALYHKNDNNRAITKTKASPYTWNVILNRANTNLLSTHNCTGIRWLLYIYKRIANTFQQQNKVIPIHHFENVCVW